MPFRIMVLHLFSSWFVNCYVSLGKIVWQYGVVFSTVWNKIFQLASTPTKINSYTFLYAMSFKGGNNNGHPQISFLGKNSGVVFTSSCMPYPFLLGLKMGLHRFHYLLALTCHAFLGKNQRSCLHILIYAIYFFAGADNVPPYIPFFISFDLLCFLRKKTAELFTHLHLCHLLYAVAVNGPPHVPFLLALTCHAFLGKKTADLFHIFI